MINERIRELATQAGYKDFDYAIIAHKFAELIVAECANIAASEPFNAGAAATFMRDRFGVKCYTQEELDRAKELSAELARGLKVE